MLRAVHLAMGISGLVFFAGFDVLRDQPVNIGLEQFAGITISVIIILAGIYDWMPWQKKFTVGILFVLYLGGILFMGLRSGSPHAHHAPELLGLGSFARGDFIINTLGFVPLGFLAMAFLTEVRSIDHWHNIAWTLAFCLAVSLIIEILQYFLPGRTSSLYDVTANAMGSLLGGVLENIENRRAEPSH